MERYTFKQACYQIIAKTGIRMLTFFFPEYFAREPLAPTDRYIEYPFVLSMLPKLPARVLDVGCAGSFFPLILAGIGYDSYGIDIRRYSITNKIKHKNFEFRQESVLKTSFPPDYFDAACAISTVEHIGLSGRYGADDDACADAKAIAELARIVKPGGALIITVPFGKAKIVRPYSRIYDSSGIANLTRGFKVDQERYYMQDADDDWFECACHDAAAIDATADRYPVCLLKLRKPLPQVVIG
jgi:SAM-dependent methyltransferase